jgi:hypothetical protein
MKLLNLFFNLVVITEHVQLIVSVNPEENLVFN